MKGLSVDNTIVFDAFLIGGGVLETNLDFDTFIGKT